MSGAARPAQQDQEARERIRTSLIESLIVEASAGTGKTTELVRRIVAVLSAGLTTIDRIAAVTFTHKAAGELKLRLRQQLDAARSASISPGEARSLEHALAHLEEASIGTIHSFCAQILRERPVEARVDPSFQEISEQEADRLYERAFRGWFQHKLNEESPGLRRALSRLAWRESLEARPPLDQLKWAGRQFIEWRDFPAGWRRRAFERKEAIDRLVHAVQQAHERMALVFRPVHELALWVERAEAIRPRDYDTLESLFLKLLKDLRTLKRKGAEDLIALLEDFRRKADADLAVDVREEMLDLVSRYEKSKRSAGQLDFLDLLIQARDLVRDNAEVRAHLQNRFTHIFVDEFQDTDPLQAELILLLVSDAAESNDWLTARPVPGKLFVVGDPKQSIYKFRRADVILYHSLRQRLEEKGVGVVRLTRSFRSVPPIQQCVNAAFAPEMRGEALTGQASYSPLEEHRPPVADQPAVVTLPAPKPYKKRYVSNESIDACLPDTIVAFVEWLLRESGWTVGGEDGQPRPVEARDICLLFRRFTNYGKDITRGYTGSLEARGIPHVLVGSKSFHAREEVEILRVACEAIEWPDDELSVFALLRGPLFGLTDATLLKYRHQFSRLHPFVLPEAYDAEFEPVMDILRLLAALHRERNRRPVAETVNRVLETARAHAGFAFRPAPHQVLANVYRLADLARNFELSGGISFRSFVERLAAQAEKTEASEAPVIEEGAAGVRIMTVHSAKGLEFPVVILCDMTARIAQREPERYVDAETKVCAMRVLGCAPWELIEHEQHEHAREEAEGVRVAYVAATRARDLLVVPAVGDEERDGWLAPLNKVVFPHSLNRRRSNQGPGCPVFGEASVLERPIEYTNQEEFSVRPGLHKPQAGDHDVVWWDPGVLDLGAETPSPLRQDIVLADGSTKSLEGYRNWKSAREEVTLRAMTPRWDVYTATDARPLPAGFDCEVRVEMVERKRSRPVGARFGTFVHALLGSADYDAGPEGMVALAKMHGALLGLSEEESLASADAVWTAVEHVVLRRAREAAEMRREMPVMWSDGHHVLEGVIDLAFLDANGWWNIVDFKTDDDLLARLSHYQTQVRWYAYAVRQLTGQPVRAFLLGV